MVWFLVVFLFGALLMCLLAIYRLYMALEQVTTYWFDAIHKSQGVIDHLGQVYERQPMDWTLKQPGVYIIFAQGWTKIGRASDVARRLHEHATSIPRGFKLVAVLLTDEPAALETELHQRYSSYRRRGEWFALPESTLQVLQAEAAQYKGR